jgi:toxin secretion/phage lysis holin
MWDRLADWTTWLKLAGGVVASWFLSWPEVLRVLAILQVLDIVTGIVVACQGRTVRSETAYYGILKKVMVWVLVLTVAVIQDLLEEFFPAVVLGLTPFELVAAVFAVAEAISITENAAAAGVPIPKFLVNALATAQDKLDPEMENE